MHFLMNVVFFFSCIKYLKTKESLSSSPPPPEHPERQQWRVFRPRRRLRPLPRFWRAGAAPPGHAGVPEQRQRDGFHPLPGHRRLRPGPLARPGAPHSEGQERRRRRGPPLLLLPARLRRAGPTQPRHLLWHQRRPFGERKELKGVQSLIPDWNSEAKCTLQS